SRRGEAFLEGRAPVTIAAIRESIPEGAALIEFSAYRPFDPKATPAKAYAESHYVAYVLQNVAHNGGEVQWKDLGKAGEIDTAIDSLRKALRDPKKGEVRRLARIVDAKLMQPLRPLTAGAARLLVSAEGSLNLIPFEALVDEQNRYLVERYSFSYLTSGRDLLRLQVPRRSRSNPLVVVDPSFGEPEAEARAAGAEAPARRPV